MNGSKEIVTISVPKGDLDNDYTFFDDGKIRHNYDQNANKTGLEAWISARNITDADKEKILKACPLQFKTKITAILRR
jgi:phage baseplate assembly protein gpV